MKLILTGATGFIGSQVLTQCLANPTITSITALSRRPLTISHPKLTVIIMEDFNTYSDSVLEKLKDADACIWCMGTTAAIPEIEIDYPRAFARAMASRVTKRFRYLHLSGKLAERDQAKRLLFFQEARRIKGRAETEMIGFEGKEKGVGNGTWKTFVVKPSMVLKVDEGWLKSVAAPLLESVRVDVLAECMVDVVLNGSEEQILDNEKIVMRGQRVLSRR